MQNASSACVFDIGRDASGSGIVAEFLSGSIIILGGIGCVVAVFLRCWSRCPLAIADEGGGISEQVLKLSLTMRGS